MDTTHSNEVIVFGGGCFWCTEAVFKMLEGVISVDPGYAGGHTANPTYYEVAKGDTGHAQVIRIEYDSTLVAFTDLLTVFFGSHDATLINRQDNDVGTQYRSIILYTTNEQKEASEAFITELNVSTTSGNPIVTTVTPLEVFYPAEQVHKDYYENNKIQGYCQVIIAPKLQKVQEKYANLLASNT